METDWIMGLAGGLVIGLAASLYLLGNGRIMGASGIIGGLVDKSGWTSAADRIVFLLGLILAPSIYIFIFDVEADTKATTNVMILILAGLLVGIGTRLANGCTSGHGVCGISRLSVRGITSTIFYIVAGVVSVVLLRNLWGAI
jgi:uncharacterized membrane protein YedE/YeeE